MTYKFLLKLLFLMLINSSIKAQNKNVPITQSYFKLTTSNGLIVAAYNAEENRIDDAYPHLFANYDSGHYVYPFVGNITLATNQKPVKTFYLKNTHIITAEYKQFRVNYFSSFTLNNTVLYAVVRGTKNDIEKLSFNAQTGNGTAVTGIKFLENHLQDTPIHIVGKTLTGIYLHRYKANEYEKYFLFSFNDSLYNDAEIINKEIARLAHSKTSLLDDELAFMQNKFRSCTIPNVLTQKERNVVQQSISIFKMSQVSDKEIFPNSHGQILASIRPGLWHIAWVRDGSFAIQAMTKLGMFSEAKKGLEFMLKAPSNHFKNYIYKDGKDYGPGVDYQISLTRYFGNGTEECDANDFGPNLEYDDFGLFMSAFCDYVNTSKDFNFYKKWNKLMCTNVADATIKSIDKNLLIKADSGPWEHHLEMPRQYTFTSGVCASGLLKFSVLQKQFKLPFKKYEDAAETLKKGIFNGMLCGNKYFKGNVNDTDENAHEYYDGGTFEIFANGLVKNKNLFLTHMAQYNRTLRIKGERPGYIRLISSDPYENQEWVFMNLRVALAHILFNQKPEAALLINYITEQAAANNNVIPEMLSNKLQMEKVTNNFIQNEVWCNCIRDRDAQYIGTVPMVGYGSAAYIISLFGYYGK